jgi:hypothetical protein
VSTPGTLTWLFPGQEHVLVDESPRHELWWAVFRPALVARIATTRHARPLLEEDPVGQFSRRLDPGRVRRLGALVRLADRNQRTGVGTQSRVSISQNASPAYSR